MEIGLKKTLILDLENYLNKIYPVFLNISSSLVIIKLYTENKLPTFPGGWPGGWVAGEIGIKTNSARLG